MTPKDAKIVLFYVLIFVFWLGEYSVQGKCSKDEFQCLSGDCIDKYTRCDGHPGDCPDYSDERYCGKCNEDEFECLSGGCIDRRKWCDGHSDDCPDNSDEKYCYDGYCPKYPYLYRRCADNMQCLPVKWICDSITDCRDGSDENQCIYLNPVEGIERAQPTRNKALKWLLNQRKNNNNRRKWGTQVPRIALALHFMNENFFTTGDQKEIEIAYELENQILLHLLRQQEARLTSSKLAVYINALIATCVDPKNFHGMNLVSTLRKRFDQQSSAINPSVLLTLCNTNDTITQNDVDKLLQSSKNWTSPFRTDKKALTLMALTCISKRMHNVVKVEADILLDLIKEIKSRQDVNGTFGNLYVTGLAVQALFASDAGKNDSWNMKAAIEHIIRSQSSDGSFGNILNTYYVLPVLKYKSLLNISTNHCEISLKQDEFAVINQLSHKFIQKISAKCSLWIGDEVDVIITLQFRIPDNSTLFSFMKTAAEVNPSFKFEFVTLDGKPYVYKISKIQDDPENNKRWFLYKAKENLQRKVKEIFPLDSSPIDVILEDKDEFVLWYRSEDKNYLELKI